LGQVGGCDDAWLASSTLERRRSSAIPMLNMKTKKPMKPMLEILEITDDAGLSSPSQPASAPTSRPSQPIHRGSTRVVRMATAYSGTTTPQPRKLPAALLTRAMAAKVSAVAPSVAFPPGSPDVQNQTPPHSIPVVRCSLSDDAQVLSGKPDQFNAVVTSADVLAVAASVATVFLDPTKAFASYASRT
jgi:hypothetical protein